MAHPGAIYRLKNKSKMAIEAIERGSGARALSPSAPAPSMMKENTRAIKKAVQGYKSPTVNADAQLKRMEEATAARKAKSRALASEMAMRPRKPMASKRVEKLASMVRGYETGRKY